MKNKKKINTPQIIVSIVLIILILLLGYIAYNRFYIKPDKNSVTYEIPESKNLVEGNTFSLNGIICREKTKTECVKELKVAYNDENHMIKIKRIKRVTSSAVSIKHEVYVDEQLLDTIDGGVIYDEQDKSKIDFDGYIYIGENKYLILVTPFNIENQVNYIATYYDGMSKLGRSVDIINGEQKICKKSCDRDNDILNNLEALDFDGKHLKYWKSLCTNRDKEALQIGITVENGTVTTKYLDTESNVEIKGACS